MAPMVVEETEDDNDRDAQLQLRAGRGRLLSAPAAEVRSTRIFAALLDAAASESRPVVPP